MVATFIILLITATLSTVRTETINCGQNEDCKCSADEPCVIHCHTENACRKVRLTCKTDYPCTINCNAYGACAGTEIDGSLSTDFTLICNADSVCRGKMGSVSCGSGACALTCNGEGTCDSISIATNNANSFQCYGGNCGNDIILNEYSPNPTSSVTEPPSKSPSSIECDHTGLSSTYKERLISDEIQHKGLGRHIMASGCPNHANIPINPNPALRQNKDIIIPAYPCISSLNNGFDVTCIGSDIGITLNGVSIFSKYAARYCGDDAVELEGDTFDSCSGHATGRGNYHYHLAPSCLLDQLGDAKTDEISQHSPIIGWAYDGFPVFGPHNILGNYIHPCTDNRANLNDCLDECNGHSQHEIDGFTYHYHILGPVGDLVTIPLNPLPKPIRSPYTIGCLRGIADRSLIRKFPVEAVCLQDGTTSDYVPQVLEGVTKPYVPTPAFTTFFEYNPDYESDYKIKVLAIATFKSSESGVDGTVKVYQNGNILIDLHFSNLDTTVCDEFTYAIYNKFDSDEFKSINDNKCEYDVIGDIYNPFGVSNCDGLNGFNDEYFDCAIGDLSNRFGAAKLNGKNQIVIEGNVSEKGTRKKKGYCISSLKPQNLYQRSIGFSCNNDESNVIFCAPFKIVDNKSRPVKK